MHPRMMWVVAVGFGAFAGNPAHAAMFPGEQFAVVSRVTEVEVADLNGDAILDAVAGNWVGDCVTVSRGDGAGGFTQVPDVYPFGDTIRALGLGRLDADADVDFVAVIYGSIFVMLNDGNGTFTPGPVTLWGPIPDDVALGDLDGDGDMDLAISSFNADAVGIMLNDGTGSFTLSATLPVEGPGPILVTPIDGDLDLDLVALSSHTDLMHIWTNDGLGGFSGPVSHAAPDQSTGALCAGDMDGDNDIDIIASSGAQNTVCVLLNSGGGLVFDQECVSLDGGPRAMALGDLDGDGDLDVVGTADYMGTVTVLTNTGNGSLSPNVDVFSVGSGPACVAIGDVDGANGPDLVIGNSSGEHLTVLLNDGDGSIIGSRAEYAGYDVEQVVTGDLDQDGDQDAVVVYYGNIGDSSGGVAVALNRGNGTFGPPKFYTTGTGVTCAVLGDIDADSDLDLVVAHSGSNSMPVFRNSGLGTFTPGTSIGVGAPTSDVVMGLFDNDAIRDIAVRKPVTHEIQVFRGLGNGTFASVVTYIQPIQDLALADLDGDGNPDLVLSITFTVAARSIGVMRSNHDGTFAPVVQYPCPFAPGEIQFGDVDGDLDLDVGVADTTNAGAAVLLNDGAGALAAPVGVPATSAPRFGDVDGDGDQDLVAKVNTDGVSVCLNDGAGVFGASRVYTGAALPRSIVLTDMDNDTDLDVVHLGSPSGWYGRLQVLINQRIISPWGCQGDITGDGPVDILDFNVLATHFGLAVPPHTLGDLNGNGIVNISDFSILVTSFGCVP